MAVVVWSRSSVGAFGRKPSATMAKVQLTCRRIWKVRVSAVSWFEKLQPTMRPIVHCLLAFGAAHSQGLTKVRDHRPRQWARCSEERGSVDQLCRSLRPRGLISDRWSASGPLRLLSRALGAVTVEACADIRHVPQPE